MGNKRVETVEHLVRWGMGIRAQCQRCGRTRSIPASVIKGYSREPNEPIEKIARRLRCSACGSREIKWYGLMPEHTPKFVHRDG